MTKKIFMSKKSFNKKIIIKEKYSNYTFFFFEVSPNDHAHLIKDRC